MLHVAFFITIINDTIRSEDAVLHIQYIEVHLELTTPA